MGRILRDNNIWPPLFFLPIVLTLVLASGCALVMPTRHYEEATPIDSGLAGAYSNTAAVMPFDAKGNDGWGVYAAQRLTEYLIEQKTFKQVDFAEKRPPGVSFIITGTLDNLSYGGNETPTTVVLTVKVIRTSDSQTLFYRTAKASSKKSAFDITLLRSVDMQSPYIEEVMNGMLEGIAKDIASRTNLPAVENP
ncbi:MAG: hypothetical protein ACLQDF_15950 [Desulfomonilia bacterium]